MLTESTKSLFQSQFEHSAHLRRVDGASVAVVGAPEGTWGSTICRHDGEEIATGDRFLIYSLTKTFIATVVMQLVEQGSLDLDGSLGLWMPELPFAYQITIRQVLNHTSGLPDYGGMEAYQQSLKQRPQDPWTDEEFLSYTCGYHLRSTPGTTFSYSNIGYLYLRLLIQAITGLSFADALRERIFQPAGLGSTSVQTSLDDQANLVPGMSRYLSSGMPLDIRLLYHPNWVAHGVIASTALDVATFYSALFSPNEPLLSLDSVYEMKKLVHVNQSHRYFRNPGYGLGLMGEERRTGDIYGHTGSGPGHAAAAYSKIDKFEDPISVAVLVNSENSDQAEGIAFDLLNLNHE